MLTLKENKLYSWVISHFPDNYEEMNYLEPFSGFASALIQKKPSVEEAINDLDIKVIKMMRVIRDQCEELLECFKKLRYSKKLFETELKKTKFENEVEEVFNELILRHMSRSGHKQAFSWSPNKKESHEEFLESLPVISERLDKVYIFNREAIEVIKVFNNPKTLVYVDPPALDQTKPDYHTTLATVLKNFQGKIIVSGQASPLYKKLYKGWRSVKKLPSVLWTNY